MDKDKLKALEIAISQIEKNFGKGAIMRLGTKAQAEGIAIIPTGSVSLDIATGVGGYPRGRVVEIFGQESSGKTTVALSAVAEAQKQGGIAAFIDAEHALNLEYASKLGVKVEDLLVSQPDTGEQALEVTESLVRSGAVDIIVIDSVAALVPKAEIEGEMGDALPGLQARLMSQALRKLTAAISKSQTVVIFINQIRQKIGVMFGNPETTPGGTALKFYASMRIELKKPEPIKMGEDQVGIRAKVRVVKNKVAPPFKQAEFDIYFNEGISRTGEILDLAVEKGIIEKSGAWYSYNGSRFAQGRENAKEYLKTHPEIFNDIHAKVLDAYGLKIPKVSEGEKTAE
ncbi:MAG: recombinase RecA [Thermodesulfovibrio sp.]|nr:recombinase RecA [Thermodesulfovibrio sp.]